MKKNDPPKKKRRVPKTILRLPDLDHAKAAVLNSLTCSDESVCEPPSGCHSDPSADGEESRSEYFQRTARFLVVRRLTDSSE